MKLKVLITGVNGQDGSYLAEQCCKAGFEVHGLVRRSSTNNLERFKFSKYAKDIIFHEGDITDIVSLTSLFAHVKPNYIYNLAAQSHVGTSYKLEEYTMQVTGLGAGNVFRSAYEACRKAKIYQASSSEMYGKALEVPQTELTPFNPISPYAVAKVMAHHLAHIYRDMGMFVTCGILNNHESERRGEKFLTQKVCKAVANGQALQLGDLSAIRDWGYAPEYTKAMMEMMELPFADDFVLGTGEGHSVEEFVRFAYEYAELDWTKYVTSGNPEFTRPIEAGPLIGDASKACKVFGWMPKTNFFELIAKMVDYWNPKGVMYNISNK